MAPKLPPASARRIPGLIGLLGLLCALAAGIDIAMVLLAPRGWLPLDADGLLRLTQVRQLWQGGDWYDHLIHRLNPPHGVITPWTRPLDLLILLLAAPFAWAGIDRALLMAGAVLPMLLLWLSLWRVLAIHDRLGSDALSRIVLAVTFLACPLMLNYFAPGNADHHSLLTLLFLLATEQALMPASSRRSLFLGLWIGLGLLVSVEFMLPAALLLSYLAYRWVIAQEAAVMLMRLLATVAAVLALGIACEYPPSQWARPVYDSLSVAHLALFAMAGIAAAVLGLVEPKLVTPARRLAAGALAGGLFLSGVAVVYPGLFAGPLAATDPYMQRYFLPEIGEMYPLWKYGIAATSILFLMLLGGCRFVLRLPLAERAGYLLPTALAAIFFAAILLHRRWIYYEAPMLALLWAPFVSERLQRLRQPLRTLRLMAILAGALAVLGSGIDMRLPYPPVEALLPVDAACDRELAARLHSNTLFPDEDRDVILATPDRATELLFFSRAGVVTANYHRNLEGYRAGREFAQASDDDAAHRLLNAHGVTLLASCRLWEKPGLYYARIASSPPSWLTPLPPERGEESLRLFKVSP